jgi:hypothetical protein
MPVRSFAATALPIFLISTFLYSPTFACDFPDRIEIPNGNTATEHEMSAAGLELQDYIDQMHAFGECVESETSAIRRSAFREDMAGHKRREDQAAQRQNRVAAAIELAIEKYNQAVEDFERRAKK